MTADGLRPIVLIGAARSGTKILRDSLAAGLGVPAVPYDIGYVWRHGNESRSDDCLAPGDIKPRTRRLVGRFLAGYADSDGRVVEKTVGNTLRVRFVSDLLPQALFVQVIRDGVQVAASAREEWQAPHDFGYLAAKARHFPLRLVPNYGRKFAYNNTVGRWRASQGHDSAHTSTWGPRYPDIDRDLAQGGLLTVTARQWRESVETAARDLATIPQRVVTVRYEDLLTDPEPVLEKLVEAVSGKVDGARLQAAAAMIHTGSSRDARQTLAVDERDLLKGEIGYLLEDLGYDAP